MIALVEERRGQVGVSPLCAALGLARATFYRRRGGAPPAPAAPRQRRVPRQALTAADRGGVLALLHEDRFVDLPPAQVWAQVLDAGQVPPCSIRTMYRVLAANAEVRERRNQLRHPAYHKPELLATGPNQVWSWDITKLLGPVTWTYYYLYVLLDIFSRYVVGWLLARGSPAPTLVRMASPRARRLCSESAILTQSCPCVSDRIVSEDSRRDALSRRARACAIARVARASARS